MFRAYRSHFTQTKNQKWKLKVEKRTKQKKQQPDEVPSENGKIMNPDKIEKEKTKQGRKKRKCRTKQAGKRLVRTCTAGTLSKRRVKSCDTTLRTAVCMILGMLYSIGNRYACCTLQHHSNTAYFQCRSPRWRIRLSSSLVYFSFVTPPSACS